MQNWGPSSIDWNIALNQNNGPHVGGCGTCNGTITINSQTEAVTYNDQYRDIEHFSKFVPTGSVHIAGTVDATFGTPKPAAEHGRVHRSRPLHRPGGAEHRHHGTDLHRRLRHALVRRVAARRRHRHVPVGPNPLTDTGVRRGFAAHTRIGQPVTWSTGRSSR